MFSFESRTNRSSQKLRSLTCFHDEHATGPGDGISIDAADDDYEPSIISPPVVLTAKPARRAIQPKSEEHLRVPPPLHRRSKTEVVSPLNGTIPADHQLVPKRSRISPAYLEDVDLTATEEETNKPKFERSSKIFPGWFQGESAPIKLGLVRCPTKETSHTTPAPQNSDIARRGPRTMWQMDQPLASRSAAKLAKKMTIPTPLKQVTSANRFSFFGPKNQEEKTCELPTDDEFLNLDITAALFPTGSMDLPTPEAIKALQMNAESLIRQLQAAYKSRTFALHEALGKNFAQEEELEETQARLENMKFQLDGMAQRALEQDSAMKRLAEELRLEREKRQEENKARKQSVVLVNVADDKAEDIEFELRSPSRHAKRSSSGTFNSDSGFESGGESPAESIFSRRNNSFSSLATTLPPGTSSTDMAILTPTNAQIQPKPLKSPASPPQRSSTYNRVLKGISSTGFGGSFIGSPGANRTRCSNCQGAAASEAWNVVSILRDENRGLKLRVGELESAVDECLILVGG